MCVLESLRGTISAPSGDVTVCTERVCMVLSTLSVAMYDVFDEGKYILVSSHPAICDTMHSETGLGHIQYTKWEKTV